MTMRDEGGADAYQTSVHWTIVRDQQRAQRPRCERCSAGARFRSMHIICTTKTLGAERPGTDLVTLCSPCHLDGEHGEYSPIWLVREPNADGIPF